MPCTVLMRTCQTPLAMRAARNIYEIEEKEGENRRRREEKRRKKEEERDIERQLVAGPDVKKQNKQNWRLACANVCFF